MSFESFNFDPAVMAGVRACGYKEPTPIQAQAIPPIMAGHDVIGLAQTGTGKTAAYALPIIQKMLSTPRGRVRTLVIAPTRELACQISDSFRSLGQRARIRECSIYGGVNMDQQIRRLRSGVDVVVACPGRLLDHIWRGTIDVCGVETLIIDEADRMFDMGFQPDIQSILKCLVQPHQTLLFSATMPPEVRKLTLETQTNPVTVQVGTQSPVSSVSHSVYPVKSHQKTPLLLEILKTVETKSVLIFARTKYGAENLADEISKAGFTTASLQGNLSQNRRHAVMEGFRRGNFKILVATDIAARGLDIDHISHVINYDMPDSPEDYTHRIGRTGRFDRTGQAFSLVTGRDGDMVRDIQRLLSSPIQRLRVDGFDYATTRNDGQNQSQRRDFAPRRGYSHGGYNRPEMAVNETSQTDTPSEMTVSPARPFNPGFRPSRPANSAPRFHREGNFAPRMQSHSSFEGTSAPAARPAARYNDRPAFRKENSFQTTEASRPSFRKETGFTPREHTQADFENSEQPSGRRPARFNGKASFADRPARSGNKVGKPPFFRRSKPAVSEKNETY
ncbi:MAG: DEAD/DEAH box helicase [Dehalococcoides mccartyi]|uniref:DEAD/DEAH box helicase n=1 Tax=Dehalococcoides mccartyi TaxID=61435 RepID=UPI0008056B4C|nr:DEAD/DEAH box helicase [Dehalococcoides mccartyi]OBW62869.1 MAG: DEAD/DEAH box helicase [Dehalococcoides mccartyi]